VTSRPGGSGWSRSRPSGPSPFARSLLFGYVGAFLYGGDVPLAERRAAALALDATLLGELLGRVELRELLDPAVVVETERRLQWLDGSRTLRDASDVLELLRVVGDLSTAEAVARGAPEEWLTDLARSKRTITVRIAGEERHVIIEDAGGSATASAWRCRSGWRRPTSSRCPTRSRTWSPATPGPTRRSPRRPARPGSASACSWWSRPSSAWPRPAG
jgi:hypothetical protein